MLLKVTNKFNIRFHPATSRAHGRAESIRDARIFPVDTLPAVCYKL